MFITKDRVFIYNKVVFCVNCVNQKQGSCMQPQQRTKRIMLTLSMSCVGTVSAE